MSQYVKTKPSGIGSMLFPSGSGTIRSFTNGAPK